MPSGNFETLESMRMLFSSSLSGLSTVQNNSTFEIIKVCGCFSFRCIIVHAVFQKRRYIKSTRKSNFEDLKQSQASIQRKTTNTVEIPKRYADVLFVCIFV